MALQFGHNKICSLNHIKRVVLPITCILRQKSTLVTNEDDEKFEDQKIDFDFEYLSRRGYLRSQKPYSPSKDVSVIVARICKSNLELRNGYLGDASQKFHILKECSSALNHTVPNSLLHKINTIDELLVFYQTPVNMNSPLDQLKEMNLPKNLHVEYEYVRFHPETDTKFGGISAYPESSTVMSDLKAKKKYAGYNAKKTSL